MPCELEIQAPDQPLRRVPLEGDELTLGRAHNNDLCYADDASLSRKHLVVEREGDSWWVADLGSKNGTLLNGSRITTRQRLSSGDRITAGQLTITYIDPDRRPESVVFEAGPELSPSATIMTSLEGLLSGEPTAKIPAGRPGFGRNDAAAQRTFELPVVQALVRAGRELSGHRPLEELFPLILDLSIEAVGAERGVLLTLEGGTLITQAVHGEGFRISTKVRDRVMREKASLLVRDIQQEEALKHQLSISEQQIHSLMAVPLQTDADVIGLIYLDSRLFVREFTPDDLALLTVLANVAAIRIDHQRYLTLKELEARRTRDLEQAAEIQRGILPREAPDVPGLDIAGHNAACRTVGGDYFDFIPYEGSRWGLVVGDVAGKGMSAALLMASLQASVQLLAAAGGDLSTLMTRLDQFIAARCPANRFITLFVCVIDPATGRASYCNAGHNPALLVRAAGKVESLGAMGTVLGILPELGYEEQPVALERGDLIAIYSDGVTEATNAEDEEFGTERLADVLARHRGDVASEIIAAVNDALNEWTGGAPAEDDMTLVVARRV